MPMAEYLAALATLPSNWENPCKKLANEKQPFIEALRPHTRIMPS